MKYREELEYISVAETKAKLSEKLTSVEMAGRRFAITSHGKPKAVIMSYKDYCGVVANGSIEEKPRIVDLRPENERKAVVKSITDLFDMSTLTRKGQKGYKREKVAK